MEMVGKDRFDSAEELPEPEKITKKAKIKELTEEDFKKLLGEMQNPVEAQKRIAVQVKTFLDHRIKNEMKEKGVLSDHTRRWVEAYNNILEKLQKALYGDKNVSLHLHKVSHSQIAAKIRTVDLDELENVD